MTIAIHKPTRLTPHVHARLSTYATLAGVALAAPALAPTAKASIIYSGPISLNIPTTTAGVYLNVVTGQSSTSPSAVPGWDLNPWGTSTLFFFGQGTGNGALDNLPGGSSATLADNLPVGTPISAASTFGTVSVETTGATAFALNSSANYVGFSFLNEATGQTDYGWAQVSLSSSYTAQPRTILGYAYENTGAPIAAGAVPEPTAMSLLGVMAAGAVGVRRWRRQPRGM